MQLHGAAALIDAAVRPVGKVSDTDTCPVVAAVPALLTVMVYVPVCPRVKFPVCVFVIVRSGKEGATVVVGSLAVSLAVFVSPPPDTVAVFVTLAGAFDATFTVSVMAG